MDALLHYLERISPGITADFEGAYEWDLEDLEKVLASPVPGAYRAMALAIGRSGGALMRGFARHETVNVRDMYAVAGARHVPRRYLFALSDVGFSRSHYWLDLEHPCGMDDARIVRFSLEDNAWDAARVHAVSLRELLYHRAASGIHLAQYSHVCAMHLRVDVELTPLDRIGAMLTAAGFARDPNLDVCRLYERQDAIAVIYKSPQSDLYSLELGANDALELKRLRAALEARTSLITTK